MELVCPAGNLPSLPVINAYAPPGSRLRWARAGDAGVEPRLDPLLLADTSLLRAPVGRCDGCWHGEPGFSRRPAASST